jgi:hypothetical protein
MQRPWLAAGISRSTWYRRQKKAREQAAAAQAAMTRQALLDRLERQMMQLRAELETAAHYAREDAAILDELPLWRRPFAHPYRTADAARRLTSLFANATVRQHRLSKAGVKR